MDKIPDISIRWYGQFIVDACYAILPDKVMDDIEAALSEWNDNLIDVDDKIGPWVLHPVSRAELLTEKATLLENREDCVRAYSAYEEADRLREGRMDFTLRGRLRCLSFLGRDDEVAELMKHAEANGWMSAKGYAELGINLSSKRVQRRL